MQPWLPWAAALVVIVTVIVIWIVATGEPIYGSWAGTPKFLDKAGLQDLVCEVDSGGRVVIVFNDGKSYLSQSYRWSPTRTKEERPGINYSIDVEQLTTGGMPALIPDGEVEANIENDHLIVFGDGKVYLSLQKIAD